MKGKYEEAIYKEELWGQYLYLCFFISVLPMTDTATWPLMIYFKNSYSATSIIDHGQHNFKLV